MPGLSLLLSAKQFYAKKLACKTDPADVQTCGQKERLALSNAVSNTTVQALYEWTGWRRDEQFYHHSMPLTV